MLRHEDADPARDEHWGALAKATRERRRELAIPTQRAAADLAGISQNTWQRLESGKPISLTSLNAVAKTLRWPPTHPTTVLELGPDAPSASETIVAMGPDGGTSVNQAQAPADANIVMVPLLVPPDVFNNLDEEDVQWVVHAVMKHGRELASTISDARRIGRIKHQQACGDM